MNRRWLGGLGLLCPPVCAAPASVASPSATDPATSVAQVVLALGAVIALIFLLAWLARRLQLGTAVGTRGMKVVATLSLSPRERVVLVQVGGEQLLLGVAPGRVALLQRYEEPVLDSLSGAGEFGERLRQALRPGEPRR